MTVSQTIPELGAVTIEDVLERVRRSQLEPFSDAVLAFCNNFSKALFRDSDARRHPELQALAFWMRKAELLRLKEEFRALETATTLLVPRGLVFHVPPSNVDTIFIYSWILSVLAGNSNVIRLSNRAADASALICRIFNAVLETSEPALRSNTVMLQYGHEREITAAISAACDVRVIWGGDGSVNSIRTIPLPPHAQELTFPDRYSLAVFQADPYLNSDDAAKRELATSFYNDTFWFDQMACSSPRTLVWIGENDHCLEASRIFLRFLAAEVESQGYSLPTGARLNKLTFAYRAIIDQPVTEYETRGEVAVMQLRHVRDLTRDHCGGGLLFQAYAPSLAEVAPALQRRDQTITHFGFTVDELRTFVRHLNGRAVDRLVPAGQALTFNRFWDGYDLLRSFTRTVYVQA